MTKPNQAPTLIVIYIVFAALCFSMIIHLILIVMGMFGEGSASSTQWPSENLTAIQNIPLYAAVIVGSISFFFRKFVISEQRIKNKFLEFKGSSEEKNKLLFTDFFTFHLLNWVLNESISILGIVGFFVGMPKSGSITLIVCALALNLYMFPRVKVLQDNA